jgi:putative endonuclease
MTPWVRSGSKREIHSHWCDIWHRQFSQAAKRISFVEKTYYVYILSSQRRVLYVGITSHIERRIRQHKSHTFAGFTSKYNVTNLVYFERYSSVGKAIRREKELKDCRREKKIALIEVDNPKWHDLSYGWYQITRFMPLRKAS